MTRIAGSLTASQAPHSGRDQQDEHTEPAVPPQDQGEKCDDPQRVRGGRATDGVEAVEKPTGEENHAGQGGETHRVDRADKHRDLGSIRPTLQCSEQDHEREHHVAKQAHHLTDTEHSEARVGQKAEVASHVLPAGRRRLRWTRGLLVIVT
ncbi:MAG TPA: hypothetical protein GXZ60_08295 [Intrasporangiaceae bacterium]|nr:hypothetical protein [Intrasporangiaceae bacterium]